MPGLGERNYLSKIQAAQCLGWGESSTFLNHTLEIRSGSNLDCTEGLVSKLDEPPC